MILTQILHPTCIKVPLEGKDKEAVITELVDLLEKCNKLNNKKAVLDTVLMREQARSSGVGSGIAIPHGNCEDLKDLVMAMGVTKEPVNFNSIDGKPVKVIIMLASPLDKKNSLIQVLARISSLLMLDKKFKAKIETAKTAEQLFEIVKEREEEDYFENRDKLLLRFLSDKIKEGNLAYLDYVSTSYITNQFREYENENNEWINSKWIGKALKRMKLIKDKKREKQGIKVLLNADKIKV